MSIRSILTIAVTIAIAGWSFSAQAKTKKDYLIVVDTSYSMSGSGGQKIIDNVKASVSDYIDKVENGDSLTLVTFDTDVKFYPTVTVTSANDRDIIKKYYSMIEAKGAWTYTLSMVKEVLARANEMQAKSKDRQVVIMVMTDSLDDPPPSKKKDRLSIKDIAKANQGGSAFIYFINLGDMASNARLQKLASSLAPITGDSKVVDSKKDPAKGINEADAAAEDLTAKRDRKEMIAMILLIAGAIAGILLVLILIAKRQAKLKLSGILEYRYTQSPYKEYDTYDLGRLNERSITIGKGTEFRLNLRDYTDKRPVFIEATRFEKTIRPAVKEAMSAPVAFENGKNTSFLTDGDSFIAGGYRFVYRENR